MKLPTPNGIAALEERILQLSSKHGILSPDRIARFIRPKKDKWKQTRIASTSFVVCLLCKFKKVTETSCLEIENSKLIHNPKNTT